MKKGPSTGIACVGKRRMYNTTEMQERGKQGIRLVQQRRLRARARISRLLTQEKRESVKGVGEREGGFRQY